MSDPTARDGPGPRWDKPGIPRKGWTCLDVEDHEGPSFTCELCGFAAVRFVHVMVHPQCPAPLSVGCVCAGHLEDDYASARGRERAARNSAARRARLHARRERSRERWSEPGRWRLSASGNYFRRAGGLRVVVFTDRRRPGLWKVVLGERFGTRTYESPVSAFGGAYDRLFALRRLLADSEANGRSTIKLPGERGYS